MSSTSEELVGLRLQLRDKRATSQGLQETTGDIRGIGDEAERTGRRASNALESLRKFGSGVGRVAKTGTGLLLAAGAAAASWGTKIAAANEQADISFTTMLGSATKARSFIGELQTFAAKTPFDFQGLQKSASSLISAGIEAKKVIPIMTSLGNATSGMGTGAEGIQRATVALQQMNAAGKISAEDLNQLRDAGVPVYDLLSKATGKSTAAVAALVDKGKLGRKELGQLMAALESGKGLERFNGLMDKQSASLTGMWSTLLDTVSQGLGRALAPWVPAMKLALNNITRTAGPFFDTLEEKSQSWSKYGILAVNLVRRGFREASPYIASAGAWLGRASENTRTWLPSLSEVRDGLGAIVAGARGLEGGDGQGLAGFGAGLRSIGTAVAGANWSGFFTSLQGQLPAINDTMSVTGTVTGFLADHLDLLAKWLPAIAAGFVIWQAAQAGANVAATASVPLRIAEMATTWGQTAALRAHTAALTGDTVAENTGILARGRALAGMAGQKIAMMAGAAATGVATAAQWAWNVALNANPLGLIVLAVVAVGAAIYGMVKGVQYAYKNWDWFRTAVDKTWQALKTAWEWVKKAGSAVGKFFGIGGGDDTAGQPPARAGGGPVTAGRTYKVGENGPERFTPAVAGSITPTEHLAGLDEPMDGAGLGGGVVQLVVDRKVLTEVALAGLRDRQARR